MSGFIGNPAFRVHTHTGTLKAAIKGGMQSISPPRYRIDVDTGTAPHAAYVIQGTRVMLGRDVIWDTANAPKTRALVVERGVRHMRKTLRAQQFRTGHPTRNIVTAALNMKMAAVMATNIMGGTLLEKIKINVSLRDHTLPDLERLDHPYARRHGSIRIHS